MRSINFLLTYLLTYILNLDISYKQVMFINLPDHLHSPSISNEKFRSGLKTRLYEQTYKLLRTL